MSLPRPAGSPRAPGPDLLVSTAWLADRLGEPGIRIVDCRYSFDGPDIGRDAYLAAHIPGAVYLDWTRDISTPRDGLQYMAPSAEQFQAAMERLGIGDDTLVVGYDDEGGHYVARLWLLLRRFGHDNLRMLDGGWVAWQREGRPTRSGAEPAPAPARFTVRPEQERPDVLVGADDVLRVKDDPDAVLLDVRRWSEFTGEEVRSKHGGRIPWARWMFWQENLDWDGDRRFRDLADVRRRYEEAGVTPDKRVVAYCQGGVRAGHTALTLGLLGYPNVQVYDGSWEEWGSRDDLPIAAGEPSAEEGVR